MSDHTPRTIGISVDVVSVAACLRGYGFDERSSADLIYEVAVPRFLDLLDLHEAKATFFLVGEEAGGHPHRVREIVGRGHEVASHTMTFPRSLAELSQRAVAKEIATSQTVLAELAGDTVSGFRAPNGDCPDYLPELLAAAGLGYDSSACPSWRGSTSAQPRWQRTQFGSIALLPLMTAPWLRLPWHHTSVFSLPRPLFHLLTEVALKRSAGVHYRFQATDLLGMSEDGVDARLGMHPGMDDSLESKLEMAQVVLERLTTEGPLVALRTQVGVELGSDPRSTFSATRRRPRERDLDVPADPGLIPFRRTRRDGDASSYTKDATA